jgi:GDP-L-fucose synthase
MKFNLSKSTKIYIAGHKGLIGSAFVRYFVENDYTNLLTKERSDLDLTSKEATVNFFRINRPEVVILAAGKVGGIIQNRDYPADFIFENLEIQLNVIDSAYKFGIKRLIFFGSSCMYPRDTSQPMKESQLYTGHPESTSIAYASSKYAGLQMCQAINVQSDSISFISVIPNSVYGFNDNFDLESSHVLSALIRRIHEAKINNKKSVTLWGTGSPKREFVYVDDLVKACVHILNSNISKEMLPINIGVGSDISIKSLASKIRTIIGYNGMITWDTSKPDGAPRKLLDNTMIKSLGWSPSISLDNGIDKVYKWYLESNT